MRSVSALALIVGAAVTAGAQQKVERPGIVNFTKVDAVVACGGATDTSALDGLKADGFKTIVNLRQPSETGANIEQNVAEAKRLGLNYVSIPVNSQALDPKTLDRFLETIADTANQPVFVHCASANRVGAFWLAKRVLQDGWSIEKATEEARLIGLHSAPLEKFALDYIVAHRK
jgi:uncharacterized protein (TIGR01244 family)